MANVWGIPVRRRSIIEEANSLGAAVTALVGVGLADFSLARRLSGVTAEFEPHPDESADYAGRRAIFAEAYARLEPWFATRHTLRVARNHLNTTPITKGES